MLVVDKNFNLSWLISGFGPNEDRQELEGIGVMLDRSAFWLKEDVDRQELEGTGVMLVRSGFWPNADVDRQELGVEILEKSLVFKEVTCGWTIKSWAVWMKEGWQKGDKIGGRVGRPG